MPVKILIPKVSGRSLPAQPLEFHDFRIVPEPFKFFADGIGAAECGFVAV